MLPWNETMTLLKYKMANLPKDAYVLSASGHNSELDELLSLGYLHLFAIGGKDIYDSPNYEKIKYLYAKQENTHFPDSFFDLVYFTNKPEETCIGEAKRITANKGQVVFREGSEHKVINIKKEEGKIPPRINIILGTMGKFEGIAHTTSIMKKNLEKWGIQADIYKSVEDAPEGFPTIIEWEPALNVKLPKDRDVMIELHTYPCSSLMQSLFITFKEVKKDPEHIIKYALWTSAILLRIKKSMSDWGQIKKEIKKTPSKYALLARSNELAEFSRVKNYCLMPHCAVLNTKKRDLKKTYENKEICIASYGFAASYKNFEEVCKLALRLNIKAIVLLSINHLHDKAINETEQYANKLKNKFDGKGKIRIYIGNFTEDELREKLEEATHLVNFQHEVHNVSSSMRFMASLGKPIISTDIYQAKEAQVIRVPNFNAIDMAFLEATRARTTNMVDGTRFLVKFLQSTGK